MDMLTKLFTTILNKSITASYVFLVVIIARLLLKKAPKIFSYAMWSAVLFRLVCPASFSSIFSLLRFVKSESTGKLDYIPQNIGTMKTPIVDIGIQNVSKAVNHILPRSVTVASINPMQIVMLAASILWLIGIVVLLIYSFISYFNLLDRIKTATLVKDDVYETDRITTPFVCGFIKPRIYLPVGIGEKELPYILKHEQTHRKRYDYLIKPIAFLALVLHWFNPLMWVAFTLMTKDMEMSCDESVMKASSNEVKVDYSQSLLALASDRKIPCMGPLAFGESNVKSRIKNVLHYRKPAFGVVIVSIILCVTILITSAANPRKEDSSLVNIDTAITHIGLKSSYVGAKTEANMTLSFLASKEFFASFNQNKWIEMKGDAPVVSVETLRFDIAEDYYISFYSNENIALVYCADSEEQYRYYNIPEGTSEAIENYILINTMEYQLEELLEHKTAYIGDNSKVSALVGGMPLQEGIVGAGISLKTKEEPYGLTINYELQNDTIILDTNQYLSNSIMLFALIDNVSDITFTFSSSSNPEWTKPDITYNRNYVVKLLGSDVREYAVDYDSLSELVKVMKDKGY